MIRWVGYITLAVLTAVLYIAARAALETRAARTSGPSEKELEDAAWAKGPEVYEDWCIARNKVPTKVWRRSNELPQRQ